MRQLEGRVAVVTGAGSGIGQALSEALAEAGMSVVLADVEEPALAAAVAGITVTGARAVGVPTDVTDAKAVDALAAAALSHFGAVHVICNNAGVSGRVARTWTAAPEDWQWVWDVNVGGVLNGIRSFVPILLEQEEGHVVNTGSAACFEALPGMGAYGASKHALLGISEALRRELHVAAPGKVGVSVIMPGGIVKTRIMSSERNWPSRLGEVPAADADPLPSLVRAAFTGAMEQGVSPRLLADAAVQGIRDDAFVVCDDADLLAEWGRHPANLATGERPVWPPA